MKMNIVTKELIGIAILGIAWVVLFNQFISKLKEEESSFKSMVGKSVVIKSDTLMIMDYSMINNNYTLSDGRKISFDLANLLVK